MHLFGIPDILLDMLKFIKYIYFKPILMDNAWIWSPTKRNIYKIQEKDIILF
jgi:hypothetical protein